MPTIDAVRALPDPAERAKEASKINHAAQERADAARVERDRAAVSLHLHYGWKPVQVYRTLDVCRTSFVLMVGRVAPSGRLPKVPDAEQVMKRAAATVARNEALVGESREVRDEAVTRMLNGKYRQPDGSPYRNADVHRLTGLTTARVAQLRKGTR